MNTAAAPPPAYVRPVYLLLVDGKVLGERFERSSAESFARHYNSTLGKGDSAVEVVAAEATIRRVVGDPDEADPARRYLPDDEWTRVRPLVERASPPPARGRPRDTDLRAVAAAVAYRWRTGCRWRDLPPGLPPWPTVYTYFRAWLKGGTTRELRAMLAGPGTATP